jgi:transcription termination factor Rho
MTPAQENPDQGAAEVESKPGTQYEREDVEDMPEVHSTTQHNAIYMDASKARITTPVATSRIMFMVSPFLKGQKVLVLVATMPEVGSTMQPLSM